MSTLLIIACFGLDLQDVTNEAKIWTIMAQNKVFEI